MIALIGFLFIIATGIIRALLTKNKVAIYVSIAALFLLSSCLTTGRIARNCDKFTEVCALPLQTFIEYRDTVITLEPIPVKLPESNIAIDLILLSGSKVTLPKQHFRQGLIQLDVEVKDGQLLVNASLTDSTILVKPAPVVIHDAIKEEQQTNIIREKYIPKTYRYAFWIALTEIAVLLFVAAQKITKLNFIQIALSAVKKLF